MYLHINFGISFSTYILRNLGNIMILVELNLEINLMISIINTIEFSNLRIGISIHLFRSSLICLSDLVVFSIEILLVLCYVYLKVFCVF